MDAIRERPVASAAAAVAALVSFKERERVGRKGERGGEQAKKRASLALDCTVRLCLCRPRKRTADTSDVVQRPCKAAVPQREKETERRREISVA